jgi:hypothetical protein
MLKVSATLNKKFISQIWNVRIKFCLQKVGVAAVFLIVKVVSTFYFDQFLDFGNLKI